MSNETDWTLDWPAFTQARKIMEGEWAGSRSVSAALQNLEAGMFGQATGFVYFATLGSPRPEQVKIGFTSGNPYSRLAALQTGCPFKIHMFGYVIGNPAYERELHDVLKHDRLSGEWFAFSPYVQRIVIQQLSADIA